MTRRDFGPARILRWLAPALVLLASAVLPATGAAPTNWVVHFEDSFTAPPGDRFRLFPIPVPGSTSSGGSLDQVDGDAVVMKGWLMAVRPVQAGPHVVLDLDLKFEPNAAPAPGAENQLSGPPQTAFLFFLMNQVILKAVIVRPVTPGTPGLLRIERAQPGTTNTQVVASRPLPDGPPDGRWQLEYRHGLVTVSANQQRLAIGDFRLLGLQVAGVGWEQRGGSVRCNEMKLSGVPLYQISRELAAQVDEAARMNEEAQRLARAGQADEAVAKMRAASAAFVKVHGEEHHDSANSFANLAAMIDLQKAGNPEAEELWLKALAIHSRVLGPDHPHTALTRFNLGRHYQKAGDAAKARPAFDVARETWALVYGPDSAGVKMVDEQIAALKP